MAPSSTTRISARIPSGFTRPADALLAAVIASGRVGPAVAWAVRRSLSVVRSLLTARLVDELILMIEPVTLGGGKKTLFPTDGEARRFDLITAQTAATGVQVCRYRPVH